eukprot:gene34373-41606_t
MISKSGKNPEKIKRHFDDEDGVVQVYIESTWNKASGGKGAKTVACQTTDELFVTKEIEVQTGRYTSIVQDQVREKDSGLSLLSYYTAKYPKKSEEVWTSKIQDGFVTVDCEVTTNIDAKVETEFFLEYVDSKAHMSTQTTPPPLPSSLFAEFGEESKESEAASRKLLPFLSKVSSSVLEALHRSGKQRELYSALFPASAHSLSSPDALADLAIPYQYALSVDLERKKIVFPDWKRAPYLRGVVAAVGVARNRDRLYEIDFDDQAGRISGVREEHIRLLSDAGRRKGGKDAASKGLVEGMRVFAKKAFGGRGAAAQVKFVPGRIVRISKGGGGLPLFDVEAEGLVLEALPLDDLVVGGLAEGARVEAKKPLPSALHCTSLCVNATGLLLVAGYGRLDAWGWSEGGG